MILEIKAAQVEARKLAVTGDVNASIKAKLLTTLIGELESRAKKEGVEINNEMIIAVVKKFKDGVNDNIENVKSAVQREQFKLELEILKEYLPIQLTEVELTVIINELISNGANNIGQVMRALKENHAGTFDGKLAQTICKKLL